MSQTCSTRVRCQFCDWSDLIIDHTIESVVHQAQDALTAHCGAHHAETVGASQASRAMRAVICEPRTR